MLNTRFRTLATSTMLAALIGLLPSNAGAEESRASTSVTLINAFEVREDQLEKTILFWEKARDFLATQPGYISTRLHQSLTPEARFQLVNVARWENPKDFQTAIENMRASGLGADMKDTVFHAALYRVIRTDEGQ